MRESWKNVFGILESPRKVLEIFLTKRVGTLQMCVENKHLLVYLASKSDLCKLFLEWIELSVITLSVKPQILKIIPRLRLKKMTYVVKYTVNMVTVLITITLLVVWFRM